MIPNSVKLSDDKKSIIINYSDNSHLILTSVELRALSPSAENKKNLKKPELSKYLETSLLIKLKGWKLCYKNYI